MSLKKHDRTSFSFFLSFSNKNKILFRRVPFFPLFETPGTRATRSPLNRTKVSVTGGITFELVKRGNIVKEALWDEDLKRTRTREEEPVYANYVFANNSRTAAWKGKGEGRVLFNRLEKTKEREAHRDLPLPTRFSTGRRDIIIFPVSIPTDSSDV